MDVSSIINKILSTRNLDVRITRNGRWMDQKVTPDVLSFIADAVNHLPQDKREIGFTKNDVWHSQYFKSKVKLFFGKPAADDSNAENEYDKFVSQPLKTLAYAGILDERKIGASNVYIVLEVPLLNFIALSQANAFDFLNAYIEHVLRSSGIFPAFDLFFDSAFTNEDLQILKDKFHEFTIKNTPINGRTEMARIFPKVLNPLACSRGVQGTEKGHVSKYSIQFSDLCYNATNWRDIGKDKRVTRKEHAKRAPTAPLLQYEMRKAMQAVRARHYPSSEVQDKWAVGEATQVHHIFPKSTHRELAAVRENLILLTPTQHFTKAHPGNKTSRINKDYQIQCLISKINSIQESEDDGLFYSRAEMLRVIEVGLGVKFKPDETWQNVCKRLLKEIR